MNEVTRQRLFGVSDAFDHPVTVALLIAVGIMLIAAPILVRVLR